MKKTKDKITAILNAITFAESGEHETAVQYLEEASRPATAETSSEPTDDPPFAENKAGSLRQRFDEHMAAITFAEAGDFRSAGEMLEASERQRTVLLAIEGEDPDPASFNYAVNLCRRVDAEMSVLLITDSTGDEDGIEKVEAIYKRLEDNGIQANVETIRGNPNEHLVDYTKQHKEIVTVVYDSPKTRRDSRRSKVRRRITLELARKLAIPLVTVLSKQQATILT